MATKKQKTRIIDLTSVLGQDSAAGIDYLGLTMQLHEVKPRIWRQFVVRPEMSLADFSEVIQVLMGWTNTHLHQFIARDHRIFSSYEPEPDFEALDESEYLISDLLVKEGDMCIYEYDFGDSWVHGIIAEGVVRMPNCLPPALCLGGQRSCPPEDCGGPYGYSRLLRILKNPRHKEHDELREWVGEDFNFNYFSAEEINIALAEMEYRSFQRTA